MSGGVWDELRKPVDKLTSQASQNAKHLGQDWNIGLLEQEGAKNEKNPGRAYGKAAQAIASWYLGGAAGGALGGGAGAAGDLAGNSASLAGDADMAAIQAGMQSAGMSPAAQQAIQQASQQGLLAGNESSIANGLLASQSEAPQGFGNTMESGLLDSGYTPSNLRYALKNASSANGTSLGQNLGNYAGQKYMDAQSGALINRAMSGPSNQKAGLMGAKLLLQQPQQQPMRPPMRPPQQQGPMPLPYMTDEEKRRLMMMYQGGML